MSAFGRICSLFRASFIRHGRINGLRNTNRYQSNYIIPTYQHSVNTKKWAFVFSLAAVSTVTDDKNIKDSPKIAKNKDNSIDVLCEKEENHEHNPDPAFTSFAHEVPDYGHLKWEMLYNDKHVTVHRRWLPDLNTYEYRCCGSYDDISARDFVDAQMESEYRKEWDPHVMELEVIERISYQQDVVRWLHKFPRPLNPRIYIYTRERSWDSSGVYTIESRVLTEKEHPTSVKDKSYVRVEAYASTLRVKPKTQYEDNGFDYVLIYYDHPKAVIPGPAYNWMVSKGGPYFLTYVYDAARKLRQKQQETA
ncbi:unnamed protein product [Bursaphelenchus okinawaensis]|uniref:Phosphatidylcholine transfer protein n=1 Tax=Bursaphelenchus okinawaensis TaxID=465554 RepID=A0A811L342_9BILA|nr:unnamed protein product [Bursaphelenchus okinawaensis]CAG9115743.1 unnamed protein product [Bursaphelenchus okinawaensis]